MIDQSDMRSRMSNLAVRILNLRRRLGLTQAQLADRLGVTQATVSRWENNSEPDFEHMLALSHLAGERIADFSGHPLSEHVKIEPVTVIGTVAAGVWRTAIEWEPDDRFEVFFMPTEKYKGIPKLGLRVEGNSMDILYPRGSIVICVLLSDINRDPLSGERVIIYTRKANGEIEATIKEYVVENGRIWLWPRSTDPLFQSPVRYDGHAYDSGTTVEIHAIVIGSYRPEPTSL